MICQRSHHEVWRAGKHHQDIGGLVRPTALATRPRPHLLDRLPEAEGAVGDRELGSPLQAPPFEVEEELFPRLRALSHAVDEPDKFLFACCAKSWRQAASQLPRLRRRPRPQASAVKLCGVLAKGFASCPKRKATFLAPGIGNCPKKGALRPNPKLHRTPKELLRGHKQVIPSRSRLPTSIAR
jgi:hypothetical protein